MTDAFQEALDDPGRPADRCLSTGIAEVVVVLQIVDRADADDADAERIATLQFVIDYPVIAQHFW